MKKKKKRGSLYSRSLVVLTSGSKRGEVCAKLFLTRLSVAPLPSGLSEKPDNLHLRASVYITLCVPYTSYRAEPFGDRFNGLSHLHIIAASRKKKATPCTNKRKTASGLLVTSRALVYK